MGIKREVIGVGIHNDDPLESQALCLIGRFKDVLKGPFESRRHLRNTSYRMRTLSFVYLGDIPGNEDIIRA